MNKKREQIDYNKLVGRIGDSYYFCDYIFRDTLNDEPFNGATGTVLSPVCQDEYDERTDPEGSYVYDNYRDLWAEQVMNNNTDDSFSDWIAEVFRVDGDEFIFDFSGYSLWEQLRELGMSEDEYPVFECIGGGRSFNPDMEWDEIYDKSLWRKIKAVESKTQKEL